MNVARGDVLLVDFNPVKGSEQGKIRSAVVVQNDTGNKYASTTIVVPITNRLSDKPYPTDVRIRAREGGLAREGTINCAQITTVSLAHRVLKKMGRLRPETLGKVNDALSTSLGLD